MPEWSKERSGVRVKTDCENTLPLFYQYVLYKPIGFVEIVNCDGLDQTVL